MITASTLPSSGTSTEDKQPPQEIRVRVLRQDAPSEESYWEQFVVPYEPNMNVISVLQKIAAISKSQDGRRVQRLVPYRSYGGHGLICLLGQLQQKTQGLLGHRPLLSSARRPEDPL